MQANLLMTMNEKLYSRKQSVIETVNDELKNINQIEHSRHGNFGNFLTNLISVIISYHFYRKVIAKI